MDQTFTAIAAYQNAFRSDYYHLRLVNFETQTAIPITYSDTQLTSSRTIGYLRAMNKEGYNVYARPLGWQYVLLDDLSREILTSLAILKPCALLETSPANYQAWLILPDLPPHREGAKAICRELAETFGADLASADPDHVGRLPGFTNRKEKHRLPSGLYPFVRLRRAQYRVSSFYPSGGAVLQPSATNTEDTSLVSRAGKGGLSEHDFGLVCRLIRHGKSDAYLYEYLLQNSPDLEQRKGRRHVEAYLQRTIQNARRSVEKGGGAYS